MDESHKLTLEDIGSFLAKLAERSETVYWLSSADLKKIQYISPAYEKIWGRPREILYKEPEFWGTYLHPDDINSHHPIHIMAERIALEGPAARFHEQYRIIRPDGEIRWIIDQGFPIYNEEGQCCGVTGVAVDITKDKLAEEALRKAKKKAEAANQAKTEFLENMRHDIRTPLIGITGFADIIKNEVTDPKIKEYADNLIASSYSLLDLLNEVLEAIKVSSGEIPLLKKKFDVRKKLNEVILLNQAKASQKNIALSFDCDSAIPTYLIGDCTRIHRIILELVTNALNFTHQGYVKLSAQLAQENDQEVILKMVVEDSGIGMAPEKQQEIYLQFKRLTPSYEGIYQGFGLGLYIAKQLIDELQGEIYVNSQINVGSTFTFIVKLKKPLLDEALGSEELISLNQDIKISPTTSIKSLEQSSDDPLASYKSRILVVEDNPMAAHIVTNMLTAMDCRVDVADRGRLAVQLAEEHAYDLIFMDIGLPDIDGYEVTKRIRLQELKKGHVPIIALTAHADEDNKKYCIDIGMNAVLTKPLIKEKAEDILNSFIPYRRDKLIATSNLSEVVDQQTMLAIFDVELLKAQLGEPMTKEIATLLLSELPQESNKLQIAYETQDWLTVRNLSHKLKGGVSYCGAMRLQAACLQLEMAIKQKKMESVEMLYQQLVTEIMLLEKAIKEEFFNSTK